MTENSDQHIGAAELAKMLEEARCLGETGLAAAEMHHHLAVCAACREQFEELAVLDRQLKGMRQAESVPPHSDCPATTVWREIAVGLTPAEETLVHIEHASRCDHCGPLLREAVTGFAELNQELTDEERKRVASLESAGAAWQERLARQITGTTHSAPDREPAPWWQKWRGAPRMAMAGVTLLAVVGVASWVVLERYHSHRNQLGVAGALLARAYSEKRTLELRIAGAAYAPVRLSRGPAGSFTDRPRELLSAEALIASQLESQPTNASWLQAQAEADVLEGRYEPAVQVLRRAVELEPHSPALLTDLATAYFQRGQQEDRTEDFDAAFEYLSQALKLQSEEPLALFNRAIVSEHQFLYQQALKDWDHYLRVDPNSQWADEARARANTLRAKLKDHRSNAKPLLSPADLVALASGGRAPTEVEARIEEYLHEAIRSWLPAAFPEAGGKESRAADPHAAPALFFLADLTIQHHGDHWLSDLLRGSSGTHFRRAVAALAQSVSANSAGEYDASREKADLAEKLFRASGNTAGVLRAQFEQTFAAQVERHSEECRQRATTALAESGKYSYPWLQIQLTLEKSVCSGLMGDIGADKKAAQSAVDRAQASGYGALYLRAVGFAADYEFASGDHAGGSKLTMAGLKGFWSAQYPVMRGYNLYTELAVNAEEAGRSNLQMAIWGEAVALIDSGENLFYRAIAHNALANAATAAGRPRFAEEQYAEAALLFASAPRTEGTRNNVLETEVRTARLEAHQGRFDDAIQRLTAIQDQVRPLSNNYLVQMFYATLGELQLGRHREAEAEEALRPALALAEQSLDTLRSEAERTSWSKNASPAYLALGEAELVQGRSEEALETYEWYRGAPERVTGDGIHRSGYRTDDRAPSNLPRTDPSQFASRLPLLKKETVVAYAILPDGLAIWVYDDRGISARWIPKSTEGLQELAERFHDLASDPKSELTALRRDARSLFELLIAPVEQQLIPGRTLVIEADGWLGRVPFEALLDANNHYLIERAPIVYSLGQYSQARLRNDTGISVDSAALVVGSAASSSLDELIPLPDVAAEADSVANGFHSPRVLTGREATLDAVRSELPRAVVFHFAGHSLSTPGKAGLMLESGDLPANLPRLMDAAAVRRFRVQGLQLAVLSACSTASGSGGSSGFDSVTDAFLRAGVPHVVASRWAVDSAETRGFVQDFYHNALLGKTVSDAIRLASLKMLGNPGTSHPYYWSAFAAYGRR